MEQVTQADRERAAAVAPPGLRAGILSGQMDGGKYVRAFAAHRNDASTLPSEKPFLPAKSQFEGEDATKSAFETEGGISNEALPSRDEEMAVLVEAAFLEGYSLGGTTRLANHDWERSEARRSIEGTSATGQAAATLRGALASIIADPDCCAASKVIARDALRGGSNTASDMRASDNTASGVNSELLAALEADKATRTNDQAKDEEIARGVEALGDALHGLSARLLLANVLENDETHAAYEEVVKRFAALGGSCG